MSETNPRGKRWVFTWANPPEDWKQILQTLEIDEENEYLIAEEEYAPTTGLKHIQGYIRFNKKYYRNTLYTKLKAYWMIAKGTELQNYEYCTKTKMNIVERGTRRGTVDEYVAKIEKTKKMLDDLLKMSWEEFGNTWTIQALNRRSQLIQWKFDRTPILPPFEGELREKNVWIWGPAGTGKTVWARKQMDPKNTMFKLQNKWWEGYDDYSCRLVIIEDLDKNYAKALTTHLKVWADRHWFAGEVKGGAIKVNPCKFFLIVTSNHSIKECFENEEDQKAIKRRFKEIKIEDPNDIFLSTMLDKSILTT